MTIYNLFMLIALFVLAVVDIVTCFFIDLRHAVLCFVCIYFILDRLPQTHFGVLREWKFRRFGIFFLIAGPLLISAAIVEVEDYLPHVVLGINAIFFGLHLIQAYEPPHSSYHFEELQRH